MRKLSQMLKRTLATLLAVLMVMTAGNFGFVFAASAHDAGYDHVDVTLGELIVDTYDELTEDEEFIITSGQLKGDADYHYVVPDPDNGDGLIAVDEEDKIITAGNYTDKAGNVWYPDSFKLVAEDAVQESGDLSTGTAQYSYGGNAFSVEVTYVLKKAVSEAEQKAVLEAGSKLALDIAKLMLLKGDIIPEKPEGWDEMTQVEKEDHKDYEEIVKHEALQNFVNSAMEQVTGKPGNVTLTPETVLTFLVMPALDYGDETGLTAIDLIAMLGEGITESVTGIPEDLLDAVENDLNLLERDGATLSAEIGFNNANNKVIQRLLGQKNEHGNLLLGKFLVDHGTDSYLEWLMVSGTYTALVDAVVGNNDVIGNYKDLKQLAENARALPGVLADLEDLLADMELIEDAAWDMISTTAAEFGLTITNEQQLNEVLTPAGFDKVLASQMGPLNEKLPDLKQALIDAGYTDEAATVPAEITTKAELVALIDTLKDVKSDAESMMTTALGLFNSELTAYGYTGTVKTETLVADIAAVESWLNGRITTARGNITTALAAANALLAGTDYEGTVNSAADIDTAITWLTNNAGAELQAAQQLVANKLAAANTLAQSFGYTTQIVNSDGVDAVATWLEEQIAADEATLQGYVDTANGYITEANKELPESQRYNGSITTSDDIDGVIAWMGEQVTYAEEAYADALVTLNAELDDMGYTGADVTCADDIDTKVGAWIDEQVAEIDALHAEACAAINAKLEESQLTDKRVDHSNDMGKLLDAFDTAETTAYSTINSNLSGYKSTFPGNPYPVTSVADLDAWLLSFDQLFALLPSMQAQHGAAVAQLKDARNTLATIEELRPQVEEGETALKALEDAKADLIGTEMTNTLADLKAQLVDAESKIAEAETMVEEYTDTLTSAKNKMKQMEDDIAADKAALPARKAQLADAKAAIKAAEEALANVDDPSATVIPALREQQSIINAANAQIAADEDELDSVASWKSDLTTAKDAIATLGEAITAMEDGLAAADEAYATLEGVAENLAMVKETKAELKNTISMLNILITMLELFCAKIQPIYESCDANDWNVRTVLVDYNANADYDALTEAATGLTAPEVEIVDPLYVADAPVKFNMSMYDVTVVVKAEVIGQDNLPEALVDFSAGKVTLLKDATAAEIQTAIDTLNAEVMAKDFWAGVITDENYDVTYDVLPGTLTEDLTYIIKYTPKNLTVTYGTGFDGEHGLPTTVPYGYLLTLPEHDDPLKEWEYTVSGHDGKLREGSKITITAATEITRKEGAASEMYDLVDLVIETTPAMTATEKSILNSNAIKLNDVIYVRMPNGEMITVEREAGVTTVTAPKYDSNVAGDWQVFTGKVDGTPVTFTNGEYTTTSVFGEIIVSYQLSMTAAQLGLTNAQLQEYLNTPFILASDYKFQKTALDTLVTSLSIDSPMDDDDVTDPLEALSMLRRDFGVPFNGQNMLLGNLLSSLPTLNDSLGMGLAPTTIQAAADLLAILPPEGNVPLYNTLMLYQSAEGGMEHYYKNEQTYINQINQLSSIMNALTADGTLMGMLGGYKAQFDTIKNALSAAASLGLPENRIRTDLIDVNSPALSNLLVDLAKYGEVGQYDAPDSLKWVLDFTKAGPDKVSYTVNVNVLGTVKSATIVKSVDEVFDAVAVRDQILANNSNMIPAGDEDFYALTGTEVEGRTYTYTYGFKVFDSVSVEIDGNDVVVGTNMSMENTTITLPAHANSAEFRYDYTVNGVAYAEGSSITLTIPQFKALINGTLVIDRDEINLEEERLEKEEEEKRKQEQQLIADLGGLGVMTKIDEGKYALVLNLNINDPKTSLMGFMVSLITNPYDTILLGSTELYAVEDYGDKTPKQIHLQALVDLILNSGLTDDALLGMIANGAFKNDFVLPGTYIEMDGEGNPIAYGDLGTQFVQSTMTFQKADKDDLVVDFYITLSGSGDMVGTLQSALSSLPESVSMELNGGVTLTADLPGMIYTAYLAALSMVGEVDLDNMDAATSEVVIGYVYDLLNPVLGDNAVTVTTIENTLALFDIEKDLSAYESYYNLVKRAYGVTPVYTDNGFKVVLSDIDISSVIAQMQDMVDTMELPGGMKLNLANLIYEYNDPAYDDDEFGLDVVIGAGLGNIDAEYNVVYVDVKAEGLSNKFGMTTADKLALQATSVVVLVGNVEGDLVFNGTTTFVDLNGYTVSGNIVGNGGDVIVVDSDYTANGGANGVSGNVTVLGGKYAATLAEENLGKGYQQAADGTVGNRLFTVVETDDTITVTLNATPEDVKSLLSQRGVIELAAEVLVDLVINHYNAAALSVDGNTIYNINFNDLLALATGTRDDLIDTALACISVSDLADVFNAIVADLTNFQGMADALAEGGDGIVSKHDFTTATWAMALGHDTEKDVLTLNLGASDEKTETKTLQLAIVGDARDDMAILTAALADTVTVESNLDLDDLVRANGQLAVNGSYAGSVIVDFVHNPGYALAMTVIVADGTTDAALKADLVAGIEAYAATGDMLPLGEVFNALSIKDICDALVNHIDEFDDMVAGLGLSAEAEAVIAANVAENEMGYKLLVDVVSYALFLLDSREIGETITDSGRTLGSFEKEDDKGLYYGFEKSGSIDKTVSVLDVTMDITNATVKVYLFPDHTCGDVNEDHYCDGCDVKLSDCDDANADHYCDYVGCAKKLSECDDANEDHYCDYAGCQIKLSECTDADENHYCDLTGCQLKISDCTDANEDHYCDLTGCQLKLSDCTDADENHYCDLTGCRLKISECDDANEDHYCDLTGCQLKTSDCTDADANHYCDYAGCAKKLSECADVNADHYCDSEGCKLKLSDCTDADENHYCDLTGCQIKLSECVDANADHYCDLTGCQLKISECADVNADHYCDSEGCKLKLSECTDANEDHYCDLTGCQLKLSDCTDADENHYCDLTGCQLKISECVDANEDHYCDLTGCQLKTSECVDANEDHYCDLTGCQLKTSECTDANEDHYCDLTGCAKKLSECVDANNDHYCDSEGCQIKLTDCVDANDDYYCDICGKLVGEEPVVGLPEIPVGDNVIGFKADADEGLLFLDTVDEGMSVEEFVALLKAHVGTENDADDVCDVTVVGDANGLIATGTQVTVTAKNPLGVDSVTYDIVVMGDTNCNGRIDSGDAVKVANHYYGDAALTGLVFLAGDTNCNGRIESGDAVKIWAKYVGANYVTALTSTEQ